MTGWQKIWTKGNESQRNYWSSIMFHVLLSLALFLVLEVTVIHSLLRFWLQTFFAGPQPCRLVRCNRYCPYGFKKSWNNCNTCSCSEYDLSLQYVVVCLWLHQVWYEQPPNRPSFRDQALTQPSKKLDPFECLWSWYANQPYISSMSTTKLETKSF